MNGIETEPNYLSWVGILSTNQAIKWFKIGIKKEDKKEAN